MPLHSQPSLPVPAPSLFPVGSIQLFLPSLTSDSPGKQCHSLWSWPYFPPFSMGERVNSCFSRFFSAHAALQQEVTSSSLHPCPQLTVQAPVTTCPDVVHVLSDPSDLFPLCVSRCAGVMLNDWSRGVGTKWPLRNHSMILWVINGARRTLHGYQVSLLLSPGAEVMVHKIILLFFRLFYRALSQHEKRIKEIPQYYWIICHSFFKIISCFVLASYSTAKNTKKAESAWKILCWITK